MAFCRQSLLILILFVLGGSQVFAATREERAYAAAVLEFHTGMWSQAEAGFAQFADRYQSSTNVPMTVLLQAQAQFQQKKYSSAVTLLESRQASAGDLADQYAVWIGEARLADKNYAAAAAAFESVITNFPGSPLQLRATVQAAVAYKQLADWDRVVALLAATNGAFARQLDTAATNELVARGQLLLAQAKFAEKDYAGASALLLAMNYPSLKPELNWQRVYLLGKTEIAAGELTAALVATTNLAQLAQQDQNGGHIAESIGMRAGILEELGRTDDAIAAYQENLAPGTPEVNQRQAIMKIAELASGLNRFADAEHVLESFLARFPGSAQSDIVLLALGELHLKEHLAGTATNQLALASDQFTQLIDKYPGSPLVGKAYLDRGWCLWLDGKTADSLTNFQAAAQNNLAPEDLAVAKYKAGDVLFAQQDYRGALENYNAVPMVFSGPPPPAVKELAGRALYQSLRANLALNDLAGAQKTFEQLFQNYSDVELGQSSALLFGESLADPQEARVLYEKLAPQFAGSPLEPQLRLAIAHTFELGQDWPAAVKQYTDWVSDYPTNSLRPQADYALAQAYFHAGNDAAALALFTQFVAQNQTNLTLAPLAQWWVADHCFRTGEYIGAETNYEYIFQNRAWKNSSLFYPAQLMAGRAAIGRTGYKDAVTYFTPLISDTNCPPDVRLQARFACSSALRHLDSSDASGTLTNLQNLQLATYLLGQIIEKYPDRDSGARAWGELGDCALQMGDYETATNAYLRVCDENSPADLDARSRAQIGLGIVLEKLAAQTNGVEQTNLLQQALENYLQVFNGENLRSEPVQDPFWTKKAGLQAAPLIGLLDNVEVQRNFYLRLKTLLPQLAGSIDKKIAALSLEKM